MKKLLTILMFIIAFHLSSAQHYGGIYVAPNFIKNIDFYGNNKSSKNLTFGYSFGYQGLLMAKRRFSFSYGLQYIYQSYENYFSNDNGRTIIAYGNVFENVIGRKDELRSIEIPATWRFNILKDKKIQPYVSFSPTVGVPLSFRKYFINKENEYELFRKTPNSQLYLSFDFGVGVNYTHNDWIFNVQSTVSTGYSGKISLGFSVMRKF